MKDATRVPLLELENLSVEFRADGGWLRIIDNIDLQIQAGDTVGLVGESGSGKSTTALALLRLLPTARVRVSGTARFEGKDLLSASAAEMRAIRGQKIAMIPQDPMSSLNPLFRIGSQIEEALFAHGERRESDPRAAVIENLTRVRIDSPELRARQFPHELSGGMRQRVVGAIASSCAPQLLIADEPTTALDVTVQAQYLDMLTALQRETELAMLFITHDLGVVARVCNKLAVMYAGQIVEYGNVDDVFADPAHWYTRALIDSVPSMSKSTGRLQSIAGTPPRPGTISQGCRFALRCPAAKDRCGELEPDTTIVAAGRTTRCWYPRIGGASQ